MFFIADRASFASLYIYRRRVAGLSEYDISWGIRISPLSVWFEKENWPLNNVGPGKTYDSECVSDEISYCLLTNLFASVKITNPCPLWINSDCFTFAMPISKVFNVSGFREIDKSCYKIRRKIWNYNIV